MAIISRLHRWIDDLIPFLCTSDFPLKPWMLCQTCLIKSTDSAENRWLNRWVDVFNAMSCLCVVPRQVLFPPVLIFIPIFCSSSPHYCSSFSFLSISTSPFPLPIIFRNVTQYDQNFFKCLKMSWESILSYSFLRVYFLPNIKHGIRVWFWTHIPDYGMIYFAEFENSQFQGMKNLSKSLFRAAFWVNPESQFRVHF